MSEVKSTLSTANGLLLLFYKRSEVKSITRDVRKKLLESGIVPIICDDPSKFRFVYPEVIADHSMNVISRAALKALSGYQQEGVFVKAIKEELLKEKTA